MLWKKGMQFCDINPTCYAIAQKKEIVRRHIKNFFSRETFAKEKQSQPLPVTVYALQLNMIKRAPGVDLTLQKNKAVNIQLACEQINGLIIHPGESFSFWQTVGKTTAKKGYKEGRVINNDGLVPGLGGGLCNLGNSIHRLVLHSPLTVTEFHTHSDALAPDEGKRVPFSAGTSVSYNYVDFRFKNTTDQDVQLMLWCEGDMFFGELRSTNDFPYTYELTEEDRHFCKKNEMFYHCSKLYRHTYDAVTNKFIKKELIWDNRSEVMYDYSLIPSALIR